ncbi:hypothetical protein Dimus_006406, partial [Dionaea muscipula]
MGRVSRSRLCVDGDGGNGGGERRSARSGDERALLLPRRLCRRRSMKAGIPRPGDGNT